MKKFIIIDGNALVHRAFHALPPLNSPDGRMVNAVYGFSSLLIKILKELRPDYIAATFDLAGPTFRHEEFADYKAHRVKAPDELYAQMPIIKEILDTFGVKIFEKEGYEADDLIGTLAHKIKSVPDLETIIATGDLDTLQLVEGKRVVVFTMRKGLTDTVIYDETMVHERYGLHPNQMNDYKGLRGDPSDNIPGVPGIGEKTGAALIKQFGTLETMYENIEARTSKEASDKTGLSVKLIEKLRENKDLAIFSKKLSTIVTDLDITFDLEETCWRQFMRQQDIESMFKELGFSSLIKRLSEIGLENYPETAPLIMPPKNQDISHLKDENVHFILGDGVILTKQILEDHTRLIIGHDIKKDIKPFVAQGIKIISQLFDTKIAAYLLNPDLRDYDFYKIYYAEFKEDASDPDQKAHYLWRLKNELAKKLADAQLIGVFEKIELPLIKILAEMELNGIRINIDGIAGLLDSANIELTRLEKTIYDIAGTTFNINSPKQLGKILFEKLQLKARIRKTSGGKLSTAASELEKLRDEHPIIKLLLQYRELQKLKTTYIEPFPGFIESDHRLHTTYNQTGAGTGRLSSQEPNLQNIPVKTKLGQTFRRMFIAEEGFKLVSFDYSQLELRIAAHIADDEKMIAIFDRGEDIHTRTAAEIFAIDPSVVTSEMRRQAKVLNFGILYGMGSLGFSRASGVDRQRAKEFIEKYFEEFSGVAKYMDRIKKKAFEDGYVETIFGRKRAVSDIYSTMPQLRAAAERAAINHPIQGTEADLMKLAMIQVHEFIRAGVDATPQTVRLLLQVHDELVFEIRKDLVKEMIQQIKYLMETIHHLRVPLIVYAKTGDNWQDMDRFTDK